MEDQDGAELCFPQLLNDSCRKQKRSQFDAAVLYFQFFICVFTVIFNLVVIISVSHFRQLHTPTNLLILSLAGSDFLYGLVSVLNIQQQTTCWFLSDIICSLYFYVISITLGASIGNMILISVDRYVAICDPLHYPTRVTVTRVKVCACMCWTCSAVYNGLVLMKFFTHPDQYRSCYGICVVANDNISAMFDAVFTSIAQITVIIILYLRVFVMSVSQARTMRSHVAAVTLQHSGTVTTKKSELKVVFLMCYCPYFFFSFVRNPSIWALYSIFYLLLYINPCLNPLIYALFYPWFRKSIRLIFSLQILQPGSRETNML